MDITALVVVGAAVLLGACVQGTIGFGMNIVAAPFVALTMPELLPGSLLIATLAVTLPNIFAEWRAINWQELRVGVTGRIPGTLVGATAVAVLSLRWISVTISAAILIGIAVQLRQQWQKNTEPTPLTTPRLLAASSLSGLMATSTSVGGPPMAMLYAAHGAVRMRATLSAFFGVGVLFSLAALTAMGTFTVPDLLHGVVMIPLVALGWGASWLAKPHITDTAKLVPVVAGISGAAAVTLLVRAVW